MRWIVYRRRVWAPAVLWGAAWLVLASSGLAQRDLTEIPDPDPEIERQSFQVAEGFEVNLFAADPAIAKPIHMNFDAAGRLWIASSEIYPHILPGQKANDKILILEDEDGDGVSDRTTVFADGLLIPTGVEPGDGGAYVANSTELLHLRDTDGDGRADATRVMLSGFGTEDTHHILHTLRWGHDGQLYMNQSIYIHSHIETPWGVRRLGGGGIWQFRPPAMRLEIFARGFVNSWGHHFDAWGQSFATDGAYGEGINYVFPGATFVTAPGATRILAGMNPGSPKHCGLELVDGRHLPEEWQGNALTNDFRGHRVCRFVLSEDGSGYASREQPELIKSSHVAFRPIDIKMGPDGAIYIADWYNPIIQHGEVDFRDPRRDHVHGRIWRVTAKGRPLVERPRLVGASTDELLAFLEAPEYYTRHRARRLLAERGAEVLPSLAAWSERIDASATGDALRLEALWTYQALDTAAPQLLVRLLGSTDHRVRAAAVRTASAWQDRLPAAAQYLADAAQDDHPRVRLEGVRGLSLQRTPQAIEQAMQALALPLDANLDFALWQTARDLAPLWMPRLLAGELDFGGDARQLSFALAATDSQAVAAPLLALVQQGQIPPERLESVLGLIAALGSPDELGHLFDLALAEAQADTPRSGLLAALAAATQRRRLRPAGDLRRLAGLLAPDQPADLRGAAARAAGAWGVEELRPPLADLVMQEATPPALRAAALEGLALLGGPASRDLFLELSQPPQPADRRAQAVQNLAVVDLPAAARQAVQLLQEEDAALDPVALVAGFLSRREGPQLLAAALAGESLSQDVAKLGIRAARGAPQLHPDLVAAFTTAGGLSSGPVPLSPEQLAELVAEVQTAGDAARGEEIFRRRDQACFKCHAIAGAGGRVGPDLISLGASAQPDYLLESILDPNKKIKENYHSLVVATDDGLIHTGLKVRETPAELVLRNAEDIEVVLAAETIEEQAPGGSLMPVGLADTLTRAELADLVRFLSELGKVGPYAVGQARVARRWQVLLPPADGPPHDINAVVSGGAAASWGPVYTTVAGVLPLAELLPAAQSSGRPAVLARCHLEVTTPGEARLRLGLTPDVQLWHNGQPLAAAETVTLNLSERGTHLLTVALPADAEGLRLELLDAPGSAAQAQWVTGK